METGQDWTVHNLTNSVNIIFWMLSHPFLVSALSHEHTNIDKFCKLLANRRTLLEWRQWSQWTFTGQMHCCAFNLLWVWSPQISSNMIWGSMIAISFMTFHKHPTTRWCFSTIAGLWCSMGVLGAWGSFDRKALRQKHLGHFPFGMASPYVPISCSKQKTSWVVLCIV